MYHFMLNILVMKRDLVKTLNPMKIVNIFGQLIRLIQHTIFNAYFINNNNYLNLEKDTLIILKDKLGDLKSSTFTSDVNTPNSNVDVNLDAFLCAVINHNYCISVIFFRYLP